MDILETVRKSSVRVAEIIEKEQQRQDRNVELIASENFPSDAVKAAMASCFTAKYAEGYAAVRSDGRGGKGRYYGGCEYVDELEEYCCDLWRQVFRTDYHVNVQPHSGSQANEAAYAAFIKPGDTILGLDLNHGGHLTHGSGANFSGKLYKSVFYGVDEKGYIDYQDMHDKICEFRPAIVVLGASAYPRIIDFAKAKETIEAAASEVSTEEAPYRPFIMVDMAHIAGLVAAGEHPTPFGFADVVTTTTHKTLRGPRGGMIFCRPEYAGKIDSAVFPRSQGGPLEHVIAAKAVCAEEALQPEYVTYIQQVVKNTKAMADEFLRLGYELTTGGTDNHLFLVDFSNTHPDITGMMVQEACDKACITLNKNCVPTEKRSPKEASGVRIGCAAMTTKGWTEEDAVLCARKIDEVIRSL